MVDLSDTPAGVISRLDDAISRNYQTVTLVRKVSGLPDIELDVLAFVRGLKPDEITDGISQMAQRVVISPTSINGSVFEGTPLRKGDRTIVLGRVCGVEEAKTFVKQDIVVRFELTVTG